MSQEIDVEVLREDIEYLKRAVDEIRLFMDIEPEVRQEYVDKLREKEKGPY